MPEKPDKVVALRDAVRLSAKKLEPFRDRRVEAIRQYVGGKYSDDGARRAVPVNFLELVINIYKQNLVSERPASYVSTPVPSLRGQANTLKLGIDYLLDEIKFGKTLEKIVVDALFSIGIAKIGLNKSSIVELGGVLHDVGQVFVDAVDLDDFVIDMDVKRREQVRFIGHKFRETIENIENSGLYKNTQDLAQMHPAERGDFPEDAADTIGAGTSGEPHEYMPMVELYEIYVPYEGRLKTFEVNGDATLLRDVEWDGPEGGPFHILSFNDVPSNIMPLSPTQTLIDMHLLGNILYRKLADQAKRQKNLGFYGGANSADGVRTKEASDGDLVQADDPRAVTEVSFGGINTSNLAFFLNLKELFSWFAGNLDSLGGLGPQSDTLGQDRLLAATASKRVGNMQERVVGFTGELIGDVALYLWEDPLVELPLIKKIEGVDFDIPVLFTPELREGDFLDYNITIEPFSLQSRTPADRLNTVMQYLTQIVVPMAPERMAQGIAVNWAEMDKLVAELSNTPEILRILTNFKFPDQGPAAIQPHAPASTTRTNIRQNVAGTTNAGRDNALAQTLLAGDSAQNNSAQIAVRSAS